MKEACSISKWSFTMSYPPRYSARNRITPAGSIAHGKNDVSCGNQEITFERWRIPRTLHVPTLVHFIAITQATHDINDTQCHSPARDTPKPEYTPRTPSRLYVLRRHWNVPLYCRAVVLVVAVVDVDVEGVEGVVEVGLRVVAAPLPTSTASL